MVCSIPAPRLKIRCSKSSRSSSQSRAGRAAHHEGRESCGSLAEPPPAANRRRSPSRSRPPRHAAPPRPARRHDRRRRRPSANARGRARHRVPTRRPPARSQLAGRGRARQVGNAQTVPQAGSLEASGPHLQSRPIIAATRRRVRDRRGVVPRSARPGHAAADGASRRAVAWPASRNAPRNNC